MFGFFLSVPVFLESSCVCFNSDTVFICCICKYCTELYCDVSAVVLEFRSKCFH